MFRNLKFSKLSEKDLRTEEQELVLMALKEGKVMLGKLNLADSR